MDELIGLLQEEIDDTVADINKQIESASRIYRRQRSRGDISKWCLEVALLLYVMMSYKWDAAILWLKSNKRRGAPISPSMSDADTHAHLENAFLNACLLYTSPSPRDLSTSRMPSSA